MDTHSGIPYLDNIVILHLGYHFMPEFGYFVNIPKLIENAFYTFSERVEQKRRELWPRVLEERKNGKIAYLSFDKIIIKNK